MIKMKILIPLLLFFVASIIIQGAFHIVITDHEMMSTTITALQLH
jgi:hypothetical protein